MKIVVTGSEGYIGPVIVRELKAAGHRVLGYDTCWFGRWSDADQLLIGDIRETLVNKDWPDVVVHLAGLSNDPLGDLSPTLTVQINQWGTIDQIRHYYDARHVVISSCAVYGATSELATEESKVSPLTAYARAKAYVDEWAQAHEFNTINLRLGTVFGHAPNHRLDLVVNRMVFDALNNGGVRVQGNAARPLVHVEDVASAVLWAVEGKAQGIYNVIGENVRMRDLGREVAAFADVPVKYEDAGADARDYQASGEKLLRAGWSPSRSVAGSLPVLFERTLDYEREDLADRVRLSALRARGDLDPKTLKVA